MEKDLGDQMNTTGEFGEGGGFTVCFDSGIQCFKCRGKGLYTDYKGQQASCQCVGGNIHENSICCKSCNGAGHFDQQICKTCKGNGHFLLPKQSSPCNNCKETGKFENKMCGPCLGSGILQPSLIICENCFETGIFRNKACEPCEGKGIIRVNGLLCSQICFRCRGKGALIMKEIEKNCSSCNGTGRIDSAHHFCYECNGTGIHEEGSNCNKCQGNGYLSGY